MILCEYSAYTLLGCVATKMDRLSAGKRLERVCARSLLRAAWSAIAAYCKASMLGIKLANRVSKLHCANAVHILIRYRRLSSTVEKMRDNSMAGCERRFFSMFRLNHEMSSVLVHRADCFHRSVISRYLAVILTHWNHVSAFKSKIQVSFHAALRRWMLFAAAKMFSAWQSLTLISCSNRDTAIKWRLTCDRRHFLTVWAEISKHHRRIKAATAQLWMRNDSRTAMNFFAAWKSVAETSLIALKKFQAKWRLKLCSTVFDCWCTAAGSLTALRLFVDGCNHHLTRRMFLDWRAVPCNAARNLDRAVRTYNHFLQKKCIRLWRFAALCKVQGRVVLSNIFVEGWRTRVLVFFFSRFRSRVREVKIEARISYYRCIAYQTAIIAWKENVFDDQAAAGAHSPARALRRSTAIRMWAHQFPPKSPSKSLRSSQQFIKLTRSSTNQLMNFEDSDTGIDKSSSKYMSRAFSGWLMVISEVQARRRVCTAAMNWHASVHVRNILKNVFVTLVTFAARSRTRLTLKSKKCIQHYAFKQTRAVFNMWKYASSSLRLLNRRMSSIKKTISSRFLHATFQQWKFWSQSSRVRAGYLRRVAEPCIVHNTSRRRLTCCRVVIGAWRQLLIPGRLSKRFARRCLLRVIGKMLIQWHHVALCTVDDRVAGAIAGERHASTHPFACVFISF